jgi:hypothetical protein
MLLAGAGGSRRCDALDSENLAKFLVHKPVHKRGRNRLDGVGRHGTCARSEHFQWAR